MEERFDLQNFDYEKAFKEVKDSIKKPNILVCGASQAGKSTLINDIFQMDVAEKGDGSRPKTRGVKLYTSKNATVNFYDSEGYEIGNDRLNSFEDDVIGLIDKLKEMYKGELDKQIHEVWFCINASSYRFLEADRRFITAIKTKNIPIMVLLTQVDAGLSLEDLNDMKRTIKEFDDNLDIFTYTIGFEAEDKEEARKRFKQKDEIIKWALDHLDDALKEGFIPALKGQIQLKKNLVLTRIVPKYTSVAILSVGTVAVTPLSFSDSIILMGLQVKMTMDIIMAYGIDMSFATIATDVVGSNLISFIGKSLASKLLQLIPLVGKPIEVAVDIGVAGSITALLGSGISEVCVQYLNTCIESNDSSAVQFVDFFTSEILKETVSNIKRGSTDISVKDIINDSIALLPAKDTDK